jgi:hypothetical protein
MTLIEAPFVTAVIATNQCTPHDLMVLFGIPGNACATNRSRLYHDESLTRYVDIPDGDIVAFESVKTASGLDACFVWVHGSADLIRGSLGSAHVDLKTSFFSGDIWQDYEPHRVNDGATGFTMPPCPKTAPPCTVGTPSCPGG